MLYQQESSTGHHPYTDYPSLEEVNGLEHLRVRKNSSQEEGEDAKYSIIFYESPYSAYGEAESTKAQFMEFIEARNGCFLREANFDDVGDRLFIGRVPRRYSDSGERLVDERHLSGMEEDDFIVLALRKHRYPEKDSIRRCLWSNGQLS